MEYQKRIKSFTDLYCWQEGHKLVLMIYAATRDFPKDELFGLASQIRRAGVSVTSNIAEGFNRSTKKDKAQFYTIAQGSVAEIQNQLLAARDLSYISTALFSKLFEQAILAHKLLTGLIKTTRARAF